MHGLVPYSIQSFVIDSYGADAWGRIGRAADPRFGRFEAMQTYDDAVVEGVLGAACREFNKRRSDLLEDLGTYLISNPRQRITRRLLRFSGDSFADFLLSLEDLSDRVALAIPELRLPVVIVRQKSSSCFDLRVEPGMRGYGLVLMGVLRAMADDYGALVLSDCIEGPDGAATLRLGLLDPRFARPRDFELSDRP